MTTELKKELDKSFLVLKPEHKADKFALQMLQENAIAGLLAFEKRIFNGEERFYYDISGKQILSKNMSAPSLSGQDIRMLLQSLQCLMVQLHSYFLDAKGIVLQFEYIYRTERECFFCYDPSSGNRDIEQSLSDFSEHLLGYTDHDDELGVLLSYELYHRMKEEKSAMQALEAVLTLSLESEAEEIPETEDSEEMDFLTNFREDEGDPEKHFAFDTITFGIFALLFLVSLGYLLFLCIGDGNIKFSETAGTKNGLISLIFLALSMIGMTVGLLWNIDIKEKK